MGPYCKFCDQRCFVERRLISGRMTLLATCTAGAAHDRKSCGEDFSTAVNPRAVEVQAEEYHRSVMALRAERELLTGEG